MIEQKTIDEAIRKLLDAAPHGSEVILFGSYVRGNANPDSDLDFLVIEPSLENRRHEMVRLREVLRPLRVPTDVLVISRKAFNDWKDMPNNVISEAAHQGKSFKHAA